MRMKLNWILPVILLGTFLVSGCINQEPNQVPDGQAAPTGEVRVFEMTAKQWEFTPSTITVNQGDAVELHITSIDVTHGFALPDFEINERLEPGEDVHVEFVADKQGTFTFFCSVPCGSGHGGMSGQLIVE